MKKLGILYAFLFLFFCFPFFLVFENRKILMVLVFTLLCSLGGYPPFSEEIKKHTLNEQIIKGLYTFPKTYWKAISPKGNPTSYDLASLLGHYLSLLAAVNWWNEPLWDYSLQRSFSFLKNPHCFFSSEKRVARLLRHHNRGIVTAIVKEIMALSLPVNLYRCAWNGFDLVFSQVNKKKRNKHWLVNQNLTTWYTLGRFSIECRKTKSKLSSHTNQSQRTQTIK